MVLKFWTSFLRGFLPQLLLLLPLRFADRDVLGYQDLRELLLTVFAGHRLNLFLFLALLGNILLLQSLYYRPETLGLGLPGLPRLLYLGLHFFLLLLLVLFDDSRLNKTPVTCSLEVILLA